MRHRLNAALVWDRPLINRHVGDVGNVLIVSAFSDHALNIAIRNRSIELLLYSLLENNENEVGILLRCTYPYNVAWNTKGQDSQVSLDIKYYAVRSEQNQLIMIHNHPSSAGLSWGDIMIKLDDIGIDYITNDDWYTNKGVR